MILETQLKIVGLDETLMLRQKVLRPNKSIEDARYPEDEQSTTFHLGLYYENQLVSVLTLAYQACKLINSGCPYRLRGMATDDRYRGQGFGSRLILGAHEILREKKCDLVWCHARVQAFGFYEKAGYSFIGNFFDIPGIGPHKVMYKIINPR